MVIEHYVDAIKTTNYRERSRRPRPRRYPRHDRDPEETAGGQTSYAGEYLTAMLSGARGAV